MTKEIAAAGLAALNSMVESAEKQQLLLKLIERATSIAVVREFLKNRGIQHSAASWEELRTKRIFPAIYEGQLNLDDLHALLRSTEGFGRQHIFLFTCPPGRAAAMMGKGRVRDLLLEKGLGEVGHDPIVVDLPAEPSLVDVRLGKTQGGKYMALKEIEKRSFKKLTSETTDDDAMTFTKVFKVEFQRAVNVARLWDNGLLEVRIASRDNATRYRDNLGQFFNRLKPFIARDEFVEVSLRDLKKNLWVKRVQLQKLVRFSTYTLQDDEGISLRANAVLSTDDLAESHRATKSLAVFNTHSVQCSDSNIYFKISKKDTTFKEIHVLLNGEDNEFAVTAAITEEEYEFVLQQVLKHN